MAHGLNVRWKGRREHMFDKFGEFDSAEEINRAAAAQKAEGDDEAVMELTRRMHRTSLRGILTGSPHRSLRHWES